MRTNIVIDDDLRIGSENYVFSRFNQLELLQGAVNQKEWELLEDYLSTQYYLEASANTSREAARIYFELRRRELLSTARWIAA